MEDLPENASNYKDWTGMMTFGTIVISRVNKRQPNNIVWPVLSSSLQRNIGKTQRYALEWHPYAV